MTAVISLMNGGVGRALRVILGLALMVWGLMLSGGSTLGLILFALGLVPIFLGLNGRCLLELFVRKPETRRT